MVAFNFNPKETYSLLALCEEINVKGAIAIRAADEYINKLKEINEYHYIGNELVVSDNVTLRQYYFKLHFGMNFGIPIVIDLEFSSNVRDDLIEILKQ